MPSSYHTAIGIGLGVGFSLVSMAAAQTVTDPRLRAGGKAIPSKSKSDPKLQSHYIAHKGIAQAGQHGCDLSGQ